MIVATWPVAVYPQVNREAPDAGDDQVHVAETVAIPIVKTAHTRVKRMSPLLSPQCC
jgi:hypothetical protein